MMEYSVSGSQGEADPALLQSCALFYYRFPGLRYAPDVCVGFSAQRSQIIAQEPAGFAAKAPTGLRPQAWSLGISQTLKHAP